MNHSGVIEDASASNKFFLVRHIKQRINYCKILKKGKYDIVHVHASSGLQGLEVFLSKIIGVDNIVVHSHSSNLSLSSGFNWLKKIIHKIGLRMIKKYTHLRLACSQKASEWLFGGESSQIVINGIDCNKFRFSLETRNRVRKQLNLQGKTVIGHIGTFSKIKNHDFILNIFEEYLYINENSVLVLIGTGILFDEIREKAQKKQIVDKILFLGIRSDCDELLMAMDMFIFPSYFEGMPITIIEAQATGLRCFISESITHEVDIGGMLEYISLSLSPKEWASRLNISCNKTREKENNALVGSGFDIIYTTKMIESQYIILMRENK